MTKNISFTTALLIVFFLGSFIYFLNKFGLIKIKKSNYQKTLSNEEIVLPVKWQDLGFKMVQEGVIDVEKWQQIYAKEESGTASNLIAKNNDEIKINSQNNGIWLNLFWGLGLGNKNEILEKGPMSDPQYGGAGKFASTGGWTIAQGDTMQHFSKHEFIKLTPVQQSLVEKISKNIYRPCCDNSTYFPDCNHGMAMLGLLELLAANNVPEKQMYEIAFKVNTFWFPNQYENIAEYLKEQNQTKTPQELLGKNFSSTSGFQKIVAQVKLPKFSSGNKCSI